jgi:AraC-like DNA-binding protein
MNGFLGQGGGSLSECGFESRYYFNRVFKKHILLSNREYQNNVND